jgi:hypothetical protein
MTRYAIDALAAILDEIESFASWLRPGVVRG